MQDYIKKFKKIIVLLCISIIAGGVIMGGYAGIHYIKAGDNKGKHSIDNSKIEIRGNIKEKNGKNIQYLLTWYVYRYIVIPTQRKGHKGAQE